MPIASAQVKSAVLLAGLFYKMKTVVFEKTKTRDHTERFFKAAGIDIRSEGKKIVLRGGKCPNPFSLKVPGDISSAAFLMAIGVLVPGSEIFLSNVLWNKTRTGYFRVLKRMNARINVVKVKKSLTEDCADIKISYGSLKAATIMKSEIPSLIDELPILMVVATQAEGTTRILGAGELRVKETDRIHSMALGLKEMGASISVKNDDIFIKGPAKLTGSDVESFSDHRTAMSFIVAGMIAEGETRVNEIESIKTSFPDFLRILKKARCGFKTRDGS
jgi:3-phosphoshikimate 1-carboxyvinyltransferase